MPDPTADLMSAATAASQRKDFARATDLARAAAAGPPSHRHENLFRMLAHSAAPDHVARLAPARLNALVHTGWLHSVYAGIPVNADGEPLPWITYPAIDFLEPRVGPDWTVLEWGCGQSTRWWAARVRRVVSVEHDPDWHARVAATAPANVAVHLRPDPAAYADLAGVDHPDQQYDAVLIDGLERNRCARTAVARVRPDSIIIVDNADRGSLRDGLAFLAAAGWLRVDFFGLMPAYAYRTCTSVFFKSAAFLGRGPLPCDSRSSLGPTMSQVMDE